MASFRQGNAGRDGALLWMAIAFLVACAILGIVFAFVPYLVILLVTNFFFIYVSMVYMLKFWEHPATKLSGRTPKVSVIVPAYNSAKTMDRCIKSILALQYPSKLEVIVINDASTDSTQEKLAAFGKRIRVISNRRNVGKAASINRALAQCKGELVACIDSDTFPEKNALRMMVRQFSSDKVGAVVALICVDKPKTMLQRIQEVEYFVSFGFWHTALSRLDGLLVTPGPMSVYRRSALMDVGGFDEDNITEDMEIALHLQEKGYAIRCTTDAKIYTEVPGDFRTLYRQRLRWLRGKIFNGRKYSHMLFNSSFGDFGKFVYPISFLLELMGMVIVARILWMNASGVASRATEIFFSLKAADPSAVTGMFLRPDILISSTVVFFAFTVLMWSYIVVTAFGLARERIRIGQIVPIIIFMTVYSMFISLVYFSSVLHEAVGARRLW
jgi:poly-beta-1,6-N-acetyl-D-glucosamine synthase